MPGFRELIDRLATPPEEVRAQELTRWRSGIPGVCPIAEAAPRKHCRVAGVVRNIRIDPAEGGSVEATITDGSGSLILRWLGRSSLQGVRLGVGIVAQGMRGQADGGLPVILNPEYELVPGPEQS